jgi:hypothetical protein
VKKPTKNMEIGEIYKIKNRALIAQGSARNHKMIPREGAGFTN